MPSGPYWLVSVVTGKRSGPYTTEGDAILARGIATTLWANATIEGDSDAS